jgi:ribonuclease P protein component
MRQTFSRQERLKSGKVIKNLFATGRSFLVHPFKVNWQLRTKNSNSPARVMISVSKKNFRKAADRNHMKRLCREAYRKNKHVLIEFLEEKEVRCDFSLIYIGRDPEGYSTVEKKIITLIKRLISELELHLHQNTTSS